MTILWYDLESIGLNGPVMRIQWAVDEGPIHFIDRRRDHTFDMGQMEALLAVLSSPDTLWCAYNAVFDVFMTYRLLHEQTFGLECWEETVPPFACRVLDLQVPAMLHGPFANFAFSKGKSRSVARVRRVPVAAIPTLRKKVLEALRPHVPSEFQILVGEHECKGQPHLKTLSFSVDGRASLKAHARHYGAETLSLADNWPLPPREIEKPWLMDWRRIPEYEPYIEEAFKTLDSSESPFGVYCRLDILFLRLLFEKLDRPSPDHHSDCVHATAYSRYHGFPVDMETLVRTREYYEQKVRESQEALKGIDLKSSRQRIELLRSVDPLVAASNRKVLVALAESDRPSAGIARSMLDFGMYRQRLLQAEKVIEADRAHPSLRVMGTRTGRMAGTDGLNWQGIPQVEKGLGIRAAMKAVAVGDWSQFEITLGATVYNDPAIHEDIEKGIDGHVMNLSLMHPECRKNGWTYEQLKTWVEERQERFVKMRKGIKAASFALQYFCTAQKIAEILGVPIGVGEKALAGYYSRYSGFARYRRDLERETLTADTDHWGKDSVSRMTCRTSDLTGFEMSWDFEKSVADILWRLGGQNNLTGISGMVLRTREKGSQTVDGAVKSALLGAAIAIQQAVVRQRGNAKVQASGANINKMLEAELWNRLRIPMLQVHDELVIASFMGSNYKEVYGHIQDFVLRWGQKVRHLAFDVKETKHWGDK